jgi:hypothetical protein
MATHDENTAIAWIKAGLESGAIKLQGAQTGNPTVRGKEDGEYLGALYKEIVSKLGGSD